MSHAVLTGPAQTIPFREIVMIRAVKLKAKTGMSIARNMPSLKQLRDEYGVFGFTAKTWAQAGDQIEAACTKKLESLELALNG